MALRALEPATPPEKVQGSPEWWVKRLHKELTGRLSGLKKLSAYYDGDQRLKFASPKFRAAFGGLFERFSDNWCGLVVDAAAERIDVRGFRYPSPGDAAKDSEEAWQGDADAWAIWQANNLDAESQTLHVETLINGTAYCLVWPGTAGEVTITPESPEQMIVAHEPGTRHRVAAFKEWWDDQSEYLYATLYLERFVYKYRSSRKVKDGNALGLGSTVRWEAREVPNEVWPLPNRLGVVPVVPFENRSRLTRPGISELVDVIPKQDAVNKLLVDMLVASEFQSFRQRWATGLELTTDPDTGEVLEPFKQAVDRLWTTEDKDVQFGEFGTVDLSNFVQGVETLVQHIASQTRTPPHYFYLSGQFPSGEALVAAEAGLVAKARLKMRHWGESWEEVLRLAFKAKGDKRAKVMDSETIWGHPESRNPAVTSDSAVKMSSVGVPEEALWEYLGFSPQQIERFKKLKPPLTPEVKPVVRRELIAQPGTALPVMPAGPTSP